MKTINKKDAAYKTIGEVAKALGLVNKETGHLQTHTIRYWETQFKQIRPNIRAGKRRYYSVKDLKIIKTTEDEIIIKRDIYYIILDSYTSSDSLKQYLNFDNSEFNNFLMKKGFYIANKSRPNYLITYLSIPSSLNMEYIHFLNSDEYTDNQITDALTQMARNNKVKNYLFTCFWF